MECRPLQTFPQSCSTCSSAPMFPPTSSAIQSPIPTASRQLLHQFHRLDTHRHHFPYQSYNILLIVLSVGVAYNAAASIGTHLILVDDPFESGAIAEPVVEALLRYACQRQPLVDPQRVLLGRELHLLHMPANRNILIFKPLEPIFLDRLIVQV